VKVALEDADTSRLEFVDAPFVEGAVAAAVTSSTGADLAAVAAAARQARDVAKF
jgi:PTS hybrid protein